MSDSNSNRLFDESDAALTTDEWYEVIFAIEERGKAFLNHLQHLEKTLSGLDPSRYPDLPAMLAQWPEEMRLSTADLAERAELRKVAALFRQNPKSHQA